MELLRPLLPPAILAAEMSPLDAGPGQLHVEERAQILGAVPRRVREFAAGRLLAHRLLRRLDAQSGPLLNGVDRAPCWPPGIVGSITHTKLWASVIVARSAEFVGVGCDLEPDEPLENPLWEQVLDPWELTTLRSHPATEQARLARVVFSAKEAAYKAQYRSSKTSLGFNDLRIHLGPVRSNSAHPANFEAEFTRAVAPFPAGFRLMGRWQRQNGFVVSVAVLAGKRRSR